MFLNHRSIARGSSSYNLPWRTNYRPVCCRTWPRFFLGSCQSVKVTSLKRPRTLHSAWSSSRVSERVLRFGAISSHIKPCDHYSLSTQSANIPTPSQAVLWGALMFLPLLFVLLMASFCLWQMFSPFLPTGLALCKNPALRQWWLLAVLMRFRLRFSFHRKILMVKAERRADGTPQRWLLCWFMEPIIFRVPVCGGCRVDISATNLQALLPQKAWH